MDLFLVILFIIIGTLAASILACLPALHIYNVAGLLILIFLKFQNLLPIHLVIAFMMSLVVAYSMLNTIPSIFLGAPDESAIFVTMPGNRYLMLGKGYEASILTGVGSLGGLSFLILISPILPRTLPILRDVLAPHMFWVLATVLAFMVLSEWPKGGDRGRSGLKKFFNAWKNLIAGLITLILSGILGFIIMYKSVVPINAAFQNIMPALVGIFAIPWVITNIMSRSEPPAQKISNSLDITPRLALKGIGSGCGGGLFAAIFPVITGGIGGLLAGHATAQRDDRLFIVSQGACKTVYYVGAFMLLFVPGIALTRGGMSWMISGVYQPEGIADYYLILTTIAISGALSFIFLLFFTKKIIKLISVVNYRLISVLTLIIIFSVVGYMTGLSGIFVCIVSTGIGMIPVFFHSRRSNCLGVLIIPLMLNMSGHGPIVARWLGLI